jgi:integrase
MYDQYHMALRNIGISDDEIAERHLHLHAWRHFFNTEMLKGGMTIPQAQAITGHKSERMTDWYCHFDPAEFGKAMKIQETLLKPDNGMNKKGDKAAAVVSFPTRAIA